MTSNQPAIKKRKTGEKSKTASRSSDTKKPAALRKKISQSSTPTPSQPVYNESATSFSELGLSEGLQRSTANLGYSSLSALQRSVVPALLNGKDVVAASSPQDDIIPTFLVPAVALLENTRFRQRHGTGVLVIVPTRDAAVQVSETATELIEGSGLDLVAGKVMDGANHGSEEQKLAKGISILAGTPVRLLDHLRNTSTFIIENMKGVVVYEAEKFAELGLDKELRDIFTFLPKKRISAVFGTQQNDALAAVGELLCRQDAVRYGEVSKAAPTVEPAKSHAYVVVEPEDRLLLLATFVKRFQTKKIVVRCASTQAALFYSDVLDMLDIPNQCLHGKQSKKERASSLSEYLTNGHGALICSEQAAIGLEIPPADWVIQFDPPRTVTEFTTPTNPIPGRSVIFLQPIEKALVERVTNSGVTMEEFSFPRKQLLKVQPAIEKAVAKNFNLHVLAKDAFRSFLSDYNIHADREIFDTTKLDVAKLARSFGFPIPPRVQVREAKEEKIDTVSRPYGPERVKDGRKRRRV
ncbi:P-loop containing nucleoside triphosphate hydrolase protein [Ascodesmis nigricans]|uniref:P-loop containing nucleoside triphosphate hydrolase protein n=1 Tax=Ascodesmis nigricans TaxID=341454 RepID=A0A4S2N8L0_9PEZI|nr:P-loop containing nucleoside triphosphate hydrolase protein [Ascodesmis nigricans]